MGFLYTGVPGVVSQEGGGVRLVLEVIYLSDIDLVCLSLTLDPRKSAE